MKKLFCCPDFNLGLKIRLMRCYVLSILYYGMKVWTLKVTDMRRLGAFEMWVYMHKERKVMPKIKKKLNCLLYIEHIVRREKYQILQIILKEKIQDKKSIGRRRNS